MEAGLSHSHRPAARYCARQLPSHLAASRLDQVCHLFCSSSSHPCSGSRCTEADPVGTDYRPPLRNGAGFLYSVTTVSGPPLAILFNNQGLVKKKFRAGLGLIRLAESSLTAIVYYHLGLFTGESQGIFWTIVPSAIVGMSLGAYIIRRLDAETFRRICMSFDAWVVGFGLSRVLLELKLMESPWAYSVLLLAIVVDCYLLYGFFAARRPVPRAVEPSGLSP